MTHVRVRVGRLHHVHPDVFAQSFALAAMGTVAEDAAAELVLLAGPGSMRDVHPVWECEEIPVACSGVRVRADRAGRR